MDAIECFRKNLKELMEEEGLSFERLGAEININPRTMGAGMTRASRKRSRS